MLYKPKVLDIRSGSVEDSLRHSVMDGIREDPRTLPTLILYGPEGLQHWDDHSHAPDYYLRHEELHILRSRAYEMAETIADNTAMVDLGSAQVSRFHESPCLLAPTLSLDKAALLLDALEVQAKNVTYYALDLDHAELQKTLCRLPLGKYKHVQCVGLQGTFEDGLEWIKNDPEQSRRPHCLLFLGSTIGNFSRENAARFIRSMASSAFLSESAKSSIILSIDSCKLPTKVLRAYNSEGVVPFAMAGLKHASAILCEAACRQEDAVTETFLPDDWYYLSHYNHVLGRHEASFTPRNRDIQLGSPLEDVVIRLGETIRFGYSHKYDFAEIEQLFREAGVAAVNSWGAVGCDLSFYQLGTA
ncbi:conserved protein EasF [Purpureocillium lilacinum]|nr:conserved protein EasF [Purpureocillium lilacinum]OAQ81229.1 conserved protein EasF [Purpureocillium lilacinum]